MLCYAVLSCAGQRALCCAMLCHGVLCCAVLCYACYGQLQYPGAPCYSAVIPSRSACYACFACVKYNSQSVQKHLPACHPALQLLQRILSRITTAVWQAHTKRFDSTRHRVSCVHAATSPGPRACISVDVKPLGLINELGSICTCVCE